ncbi:FUSC family protein [Legionella yabuuchiae]|uniref:FUSC family protein n=1 Tax=Legionella yabuuchiae TaxID=376727 RepID=UPI00105509EC|nr:FUSC family protein [Legionella yabuuchiae]
MNLKNTTKMGLQAAVAIAIAELISLNFKVERGYWITLTAMALTTQTWGESIKRSFERVGMTVLGGAAGTALYFTLPANNELILAFLLFFVFFTSFMMPIYHLIAVFF